MQLHFGDGDGGEDNYSTVKTRATTKQQQQKHFYLKMLKN
jgi:hypothetical protein